MPAAGFFPHELACSQEQGIDVRAMRGHVKVHQGVGTEAGKSLRLVQCLSDRIVKGLSRL